MAAFEETGLTFLDADGKSRARLDWEMLRYGPVALFRKPVVVADAISWLEQHSYKVVQVDCEHCTTEEDVLWALGAPLGFQRWPSPGLDGFNDDCRNIEVPQESGMAIVLHRFDAVFAAMPEFAHTVLDILALASWDNLLFGRRLICMVRTEDPHIQFGPLGGHEPWWNGREWFIKDRT